MGKQNNFLQPLNTTWFVKFQTDLLIVGLKVKWFVLTASLVIKGSIRENSTIHTSINQDYVYVYPLNLFFSFFPPTI